MLGLAPVEVLTALIKMWANDIVLAVSSSPFAAHVLVRNNDNTSSDGTTTGRVAVGQGSMDPGALRGAGVVLY